MKVEDMIVGMKKRDPDITDLRGNKIKEGDFVTIVSAQPLLFKVVEIKQSGVETPKGPTPAFVRLVCEVGLLGPKGAHFDKVVKVCNPESEHILDHLANEANKV